MHRTLLEKWNSISLRTKITGVTVLMLTVGLVVSGVGTMTFLREYMLQQVDTQLRGAYSDLSTFLGPNSSPLYFKLDDATTAPREHYVGVLDANGILLTDNSDSDEHRPNVSGLGELAESAETHQSVYIVKSRDGREEWHTAVRSIYLPNGSIGAVVVAHSLQETEAVTTAYLSIFLAFGVGVVVLGAMLTRLLVTSTFAPLRQVEATAAAIAEGDYSQRMSGDTPNTEVGRLNRSLNTMLSRIDRAFADRARTIEQMRRFVGDASHELRTPLVSVRGYAELYRMGALQSPDEVAKAMDRIEREAIRMGALVEDLLELARLDETRPLKVAPVDLVPIAADAALDARASSPGRTVSIVVPSRPEPLAFAPAIESNTPAGPGSGPGAPDADEPGRPTTNTGAIRFAGAMARWRGRRARTSPEIAPTEQAITSLESERHTGARPIVLGDENKIRQVVVNLIGNALRFTPEDSPIEVAVSVDDIAGKAILEVIDHGEGIPPQIREKIFQRFWRADSSRARETGGSGLGLAIVSSIVQAHGGSVEALETPGGGATFRVTLPLADEATDDPDAR